ncbi:DUF2931 family protein [Dyadobacter sp. CY327]|uniref:DUF2931 family protein n=1 Tax=Dyadobacter sp. CY327 TaxID=2907301 RepID=UPI001F247574|nr:DUF2931 family protein [Dyadobacter sp. CY327]MCE7070778.1 DUF2931 family protein [Dyadobacter sp. CY327]
MKVDIKLIYILFQILLFGCVPNQRDTGMKTYTWLVTSCAPEDFPVEVMDGFFLLPDGRKMQIQIRSVVKNGWGKIGALILSDEDKQALPLKMYIKWFSLRERKFYQGMFDLESNDLEQAIAEKKISPVDGTEGAFKYFVVGTAPEGGVSLWLTGSGVCKEIGFFRADEIQVDTTRFIGASRSLEFYADALLNNAFTEADNKNVRLGNYPLGKWSREYRKIFDWGFSFVSSPKGQSALISLFNGEVIFLPNTLEIEKFQNHPIPERIEINWLDKDGEENILDIHFDESEILTVFEHFAGYKSGIKVQIEFNSIDANTRIFVKNNEYVAELKKCVIQNF